MNQLQRSSKRISDIGINQEESLLQESADREAELLRNISDLEMELKNSKHLLDQFRFDSERLNNGVAELRQTLENTEMQNKQMRKDLKEYKFREARNLSDYSELEEENVVLQKQLSQLKQTQVDYEAMKHEIKRLKEDVEEITIEMEELDKLKKITEKNLEEALQLLQVEREQKHSLKKELDQRIASESMFNLHSLAGLGFGHADSFRENHEDHDNPEFKANRSRFWFNRIIDSSRCCSFSEYCRRFVFRDSCDASSEVRTDAGATGDRKIKSAAITFGKPPRTGQYKERSVRKK